MKTFTTKEAAANFLESHGFIKHSKGFYYPAGIYECRYGEYSKPDYFIRKIRNKNCFGIYKKSYFYNGTFNAPKDHWLTEEECFCITTLQK